MTFTQEGGLGREAPWSQEMRSVSPVLKASSLPDRLHQGNLNQAPMEDTDPGEGRDALFISSAL